MIYVFAVRPILISEKAFKSFDASPVIKDKLRIFEYMLQSHISSWGFPSQLWPVIALTENYIQNVTVSHVKLFLLNCSSFSPR